MTYITDALTPESIVPPAATLPILKGVFAWVIAVHVLGFVAVGYLVAVRCSIATVTMAVCLFFACHLSITAGAHRLYAHEAFKATVAYELIILSLFSATFQFSALIWAYVHRLHHAFTDTRLDPHSARYSFWWAHWRWHIYTPTRITRPSVVRHLLKNRLVLFQHKHHFVLAVVFGLAVPTALGWLWGDLWGGLLVGGFLRLAVQYHSTWSINSIAHSFGKRPYGPVGSARANRWLAIPTVGEGGDHARHHLAEESYIIGARWSDFDIGAWFIWLCSKVDLTYDLVTVADEIVQERARRTLQSATQPSAV